MDNIITTHYLCGKLYMQLKSINKKVISTEEEKRRPPSPPSKQLSTYNKRQIKMLQMLHVRLLSTRMKNIQQEKKERKNPGNNIYGGPCIYHGNEW